LSADWTNQLDDANGCDDVVALMYEIGRRCGSDVDRRTWTVSRHESEPESTPADLARETYRSRRDGRINR
jgi:hypothetical protein